MVTLLMGNANDVTSIAGHAQTEGRSLLVQHARMIGTLKEISA